MMRKWSRWLFFLAAFVLVVAIGSDSKSFVRASRGGFAGKKDADLGLQDPSTKVLITGFEPFKNFKTNPSKEVAMAMNNVRSKGLAFEGWALPVTEDGVKLVESELQSNNPYQWSLIIHLGLEDAAKGLKFEVAALNNKGSDNTSAVPDGPMLLPSTVDLGLLGLKKDLSLSLPLGKETWSRDAGHYYCNELYYRTLYAVRWGQLYPPGPTPGVQGGHQKLIPVLFIHLPEASEAMTIQDMANIVAEVAYTALNLI